ncbi:MAG: hypothetical protein Harvfovirus9_18 [Harvfovirus sp.]|uniref:Methyltransferase n=1 Tax=Harvfovirus sp. TaxID=2487768 RepID=A0A3G5A0Z9_9VIRU|nr:MAG: hypothetical protein Harvfovirus9_18 [Harvfovirus sp.]
MNFTTVEKNILYEMISFYGRYGFKNIISGVDNWVLSVDDFGQLVTFRKHFGYSIPSNGAIQKMKKFIDGQKVLEIGAGMGLFAYLLSIEKVDVVATDDYSWGTSSSGYNFMKIEKLSYAQAIARYIDRKILLIIWPPFNDPMAERALDLWKGDKIIYIGEPKTYACATDRFFEILEADYELIETIDIPHIEGLFDKIYFYQRN